MKILSLETSTTSAKSMLYDTASGISETVTHPYKYDYSGFNRISQAEECYIQMLEAGREVISLADSKRKDGGLSAKEIGIVALVGVWHSIFLADKDLKPSTPIYHWNHTGAADVCREIRKDTKATKEYYSTSGCMVNAIYPFFKIEMMRRMGLPVKDSYLLSQGAYNTFRMTGEMAATRCNASGDGLLNIHTREYNWDGLKEYGVQNWQLFSLTDSEINFSLKKEAADFLGLPEGLPVLPANSDGGSNQIGAGASKDGVMTFSVGTSGAIRLSTQKAVLPEGAGTWCYLSPKGYLSGAATNGCCICTDWVKNRLFPAGTSYEAIEKEIRDYETPPVFLPFLTGERCPGWNDERKGGFHEVKLSHTAGDLYYAALQGVLFNLYQCYQDLISVNPQPDQIMLSGGILKSEMWTQMCADIFCMDMSVTDAVQGSLLGGIVLGMESIKVLADVNDYQPKVMRMYHPDKDKHKLYMQQYERYLTCYRNS